MGTFNHSRIRREAHNLSRANSGWNPFGHTFRRNSRQTWNGTAADVEARPNANDDNGAPMGHAATAPGHAPYDGSPAGDDEADERTPLPTRKERDVADGELRTQQQESDETYASGSTAANQNRVETESGPEADEEKKKPKEHRLFKSLQPKEPFTLRNQVFRTIFGSWINILLLAAPAGIALGFIPNMNGIIIFVVNFIAIVPLAAMLSFATEEIALRTGETLGGLLNASFGNAVELIVAIIALSKREVVIVQTSLIGSILSNLLLVLGMCFFAGGLHREEQHFNTTVAQTAASLLALSVAGVIVPTVFDRFSDTPQLDVAQLSRGTSVLLLLVYCGYLFFQLKTHHEVFSKKSQKVAKKRSNSSLREGAIRQAFVGPAGLMGVHGLSQHDDNQRLREQLLTTPEDEEEEEPQLHFLVACGTLLAATVVIALCAEFMVDGISAVTAGGRVSEEFVGLILLPIVGNAAEHATAVTVAIKDKMDLAIGVAVGSSMQVALLIIPVMVIIGWGMGVNEMTLSFDPFQVAVMFVAVLLVNYLIGDGKSHWLEGMMLMTLYLIIAVCSWWYPTKGAV